MSLTFSVKCRSESDGTYYLSGFPGQSYVLYRFELEQLKREIDAALPPQEEQPGTIFEQYVNRHYLNTCCRRCEFYNNAYTYSQDGMGIYVDCKLDTCPRGIAEK